jgi:hypothetical protein
MDFLGGYGNRRISIFDATGPITLFLVLDRSDRREILLRVTSAEADRKAFFQANKKKPSLSLRSRPVCHREATIPLLHGVAARRIGRTLMGSGRPRSTSHVHECGAVPIQWNALLGGLPDGQSPRSCGPPTRQKCGWVNVEEARKLDHLVFGELAIAVQDIRDG